MSLIEIYKQPKRRNYDQPKPFNSIRRKQYLTLPLHIADKVNNLKSESYKVYFPLMYGYFKAQGKIFTSNFPERDVKFVADKLGLNYKKLQPYNNREAISQHKKTVIELCNFHPFDFESENWVRETVRTELQSETYPSHILDDITKDLFRKRIENPLYNRLATILTDEIRRHQRDLGQKVIELLTDESKEMLEILVTSQEREDKLGFYPLTKLKYFKPDINRQSVQYNLEIFSELQRLHGSLGDLQAKLGLTEKGLSYYASTVQSSPAANLAIKTLSEKYLYLSCFAIIQYRKITDHLAYSIIKAVDSAINQTRIQDQKQFFGQKSEIIKTLQFWEKSFLSEKKVIFEIKQIMNSQATDADRGARVKAILNRYDREQASKKEQEKRISAEKIKDKFTILEEKSRELQAKVSDIFRRLVWDSINSQEQIMDALGYFQDRNGDVGKHAPVDFLSKEEQKIFENQDNFRTGLYKVLLFQHTVEGLKNGSVSLLHSFGYKAFENYLIPLELWQKDKLNLIQKADIMEFITAPAVLEKLRQKLIRRYKRTNTSILNGNNKHFKLGRNKRDFTVSTPGVEEEENDSLSVVFPLNKAVDITQVLRLVNKFTGFIDVFEHSLKRYAREKPVDDYFYAGLVALGCNLGLSSIGQITKELNESTFNTTVEKYFDTDTIERAITTILTKTEKMPVAQLYRSDKVHTASDGQKYSAINTMLARFSRKYFGRGQGIVADTLITDNYLPAASKLIAANDREAIHTLDLIKRNVVVNTQIHSTDTHGVSNAVFAISPYYYVQMAPRDVSISRQPRVTFRREGTMIKDYQDKKYPLAPTNYVDEQLIEDMWDDILRFVCTIKLNYSTASQLFKKLYGHQRQHKLSQAIDELGQIYRTLHNLEYVHSLEFRQEIEGSLNKIESYNRFADVVFSQGGGEFDARTESQQEQSEACKRLIISCIICWNYLYLNTLLTKKETETEIEELKTLIMQGSPLIWRHINLLGKYNFSEEYNQDTVGIELTKVWGEN